jgi:hypothetical protein
MKISYRTSSILVLLVLLAAILTPESLTMRRPVLTRLANGDFPMDFCNTTEYIGWKYRLAAYVWVVTFLIMIVQGLRKRTVFRLTAMVSLVAFGITLHHELWRVQHCYSNFGIASFCFWTWAVALMCLHHFLQRPVPATGPGSEAA